MPRPIATLLKQLSPDAPPALTAEVVGALVTDALSAVHPLISLGATLRHNTAHLPDDFRDALRQQAHAALVSARTPAAAANPTTRDWLTTREAAARLGVGERTLLDRLRDSTQRQRLGWPMWDGHQWWIAAAAVDPDRRASFLSVQPTDEPQPELLPVFCRRGPEPAREAKPTVQAEYASAA